MLHNSPTCWLQPLGSVFLLHHFHQQQPAAGLPELCKFTRIWVSRDYKTRSP